MFDKILSMSRYQYHIERIKKNVYITIALCEATKAATRSVA